MDVLSYIPIGQVGAGALLALVIILIVRGDLIPRRVHEEVREDRARQQRTNEILVETNRILAASTSTGAGALEEIQREATERVDKREEGKG